MIKEINLDLLTPHPENCNYMDSERLEKLRRHIERTGRYEPLTVRSHPDERGKFQVINGHNRLKVLKELGYLSANCSVWEIDDAQTRLYLATLNRLCGKDIPERRATLIEDLLKDSTIDELAKLLPDRRKLLEELEELTRKNPVNLELEKPSELNQFQSQVMMAFMIDEAEANEVNLALDLVINQMKGKLSRSQALIQIARFYIEYWNLNSDKND